MDDHEARIESLSKAYDRLYFKCSGLEKEVEGLKAQLASTRKERDHALKQLTRATQGSLFEEE